MSNRKIKRSKPEGPANLYCYFIKSNPTTSFNPISKYPSISSTAFVGPFSSIIGDITIDKNVFIGCNVTLRADEGTPFYIGYNSNIQDGVIFHGLRNKKCTVDGKTYSIYIGKEVTIGHGALVHGPSIIGDRVFVGFNAVVFNAIVEDGCYIDTTAVITGGIRLRANTYVPIGAVIDTQEKADNLKKVLTSKEEFAKEVVQVNNEFSLSYSLELGEAPCS